MGAIHSDSASLLSQLPAEELEAFCLRFGVRELSIFGSVLTRGFKPKSDVDFLVSFKPGQRVTFTTLARMQRELEERLGRKVDIVPKEGLKAKIRDRVLADARIVYAA